MVYENQSDYYQALKLADEANDSTVFIEFMLKMIRQTLDKYTTAHPIMSDKMSDSISDKMSDTEYQLFIQVQAYLTKHSQITNAQAQKLLGKSATTVRRYLTRWVAYGLLEAVGENRQRVYHLTSK